MKNEFDLSWFDLSKYDAVKDFDGYDVPRQRHVDQLV